MASGNRNWRLYRYDIGGCKAAINHPALSDQDPPRGGFFYMLYTPPTTKDLADLKAKLDLTGEQMAELFGVGGSHQWRKYTGGAQPREMSAQMLFFAAAQLALSKDEIERVLTYMRVIGAEIDLDANRHD
jgi:hypothetical protein